MQVPGVSGMTVAPETRHTGGAAEPAGTSRAPARKDTASPEDAWADTTNGTPTTARPGTVKPEMDCGRVPRAWTVNSRGRLADAKSWLPPWTAVMLQSPAARVSTVVPDTAHAAGICGPGPVPARRLTARPEVAVTGRYPATPAGSAAARPGRRGDLAGQRDLLDGLARLDPERPVLVRGRGEPGAAALGGGDHAAAGGQGEHRRPRHRAHQRGVRAERHRQA